MDRKPTLPLQGKSLRELIEEYRRRLNLAGPASSIAKRRVRNDVLRDAGQLNYDHVEGEFRKLADRLKWPQAATLKDLRHLFATCLEDAGTPEFYRRYFMGQSFGRAPISIYTHLTEEKIKEHFQRAMDTEFAPILRAIEVRTGQLANLAETDRSASRVDQFEIYGALHRRSTVQGSRLAAPPGAGAHQPAQLLTAWNCCHDR